MAAAAAAAAAIAANCPSNYSEKPLAASYAHFQWPEARWITWPCLFCFDFPVRRIGTAIWTGPVRSGLRSLIGLALISVRISSTKIFPTARNFQKKKFKATRSISSKDRRNRSYPRVISRIPGQFSSRRQDLPFEKFLRGRKKIRADNINALRDIKAPLKRKYKNGVPYTALPPVEKINATFKF